jgi:hypothetical protein
LLRNVVRFAYALRYIIGMHALKAHVRNGRIIVDEPTDLPDGTELELMQADDDDMSAAEREALDAVLLKAVQNVRAGHTVDADAVLAELGVTR